MELYQTIGSTLGLIAFVVLVAAFITTVCNLN